MYYVRMYKAVAAAHSIDMTTGDCLFAIKKNKNCAQMNDNHNHL